MTFGQIETLAREYSRTSASGASQTRVFEYINEGIVEFGRDANGLPFEEYLTIDGSFDLEPNQAFKITIVGSTNNDIDSDVVVTSASASNQTGTQTAATLQTQIRAAIGGSPDLTVAWSKFKFTIDAIDSTSIDITSPDDSTQYTDYVAELFGGSQSATATEVECGFPQDCTMEADLAADSVRVNKVLWDDYLLYPSPRDYVIEPEVSGDPYYYNVRGTKIRVVPSPTSQKKFYIEYKGVPSAVTSPTTSSNIPTIPAKYQRALAYWVAFQLLLGAWEDDLANRRYAEYKRIVNQYRMDYANNDTETTTRHGRHLWYTVGGASG
jgi:hypothetical protein